MSSPLLESLKSWLDPELEGVEFGPTGLQAAIESRYGEVTIRVENDVEAAALRVLCTVPPPAGAGAEFLIWCLSTNVSYWDVKFGLDDTGALAIHADLEAEGPTAEEGLAHEVVDRIESIVQLLDEDLAEYLLRRGLGTPAQRERWLREPTTDSVAPGPGANSSGELGPSADD